MSTAYIESVPWQSLQHAYGEASDLPEILEQVASRKGRKLLEPMEELCSRVLHQGTIYSASPPVVHFIVELLGSVAPAEKAIFYEFLTGFAEAGRTAIKDGRAIPCCAGGDPVDGQRFATNDSIGAGLCSRSGAPGPRNPRGCCFTADLISGRGPGKRPSGSQSVGYRIRACGARGDFTGTAAYQRVDSGLAGFRVERGYDGARCQSSVPASVYTTSGLE
jgi:hypothetical protein